MLTEVKRQALEALVAAGNQRGEEIGMTRVVARMVGAGRVADLTEAELKACKNAWQLAEEAEITLSAANLAFFAGAGPMPETAPQGQ